MAQFTNGEISTGHARKLAQNYLRNKWIPCKLKTDKDKDSKACWFSSKTLLAVLGLPESTPTGVVNGARFYFAAYENSDDLSIPPLGERKQDYKDSMTLVIIQTKRGNADNDHIDILDSPTDFPEYDKGIIQFNDGQLCPPPNCGTPGSLLDEDYVKP